MNRYRIAVSITALAGTLGLMACGSAPRIDSAADPEFAALQERGEVGMGVDQYVPTHVFDDLPEGGRIDYQHDNGDPEGVAAIREHLREIQAAFEAGDFSTPAFVPDREVPGTDVMAARREHIAYSYQDLPWGGELKLATSDPEALEAIRVFMALQRDDHRAEGMDHDQMDHGDMDHGPMDHGTMRPGGMGPGAMWGGGMGPGAVAADDPAFATDMQITMSS